MGDNGAINGLTVTDLTACNGPGYYWNGANISSKDFASNLVYTGETKWDYGITLNEDAVKEIVEKITKERELAKITPNDGPEIPKWTGFLPI